MWVGQHVAAVPMQSARHAYHVVEHVSKHGWDGSCLSDDVLQSKKNVPGYVFRATSKEWTARGKVIADSMKSTVLHVLKHFFRSFGQSSKYNFELM